MFEDDVMDFLADDEVSPAEQKGDGQAEDWKVMIIDDDPSVHEATIFSLGRVRYQDRGIRWISAYSAKEAKLLLGRERDIAMLFLDVVMEEEHAGLDFAKWFREENVNPSTRIILRTGQPGQAPEQQIIVEYDLHDYKTKTELTSDKLFTSTIAALRAYREMTKLEEMRRGLENVVHATNAIFQMQRLPQYIQSVLGQTKSVLGLQNPAVLCARQSDDGWEIIDRAGDSIRTEEEALRLIDKAEEGMEIAEDGSYAVQVLRGDIKKGRYALYIESKVPLSDVQQRMFTLYCNNVSVGLSNMQLYDSLVHANRVTVMAMAQVTESRDQSTGEHVYRIASGTELLTKALFEQGLYQDELSQEVVETLGFSSTLHDIGKVTIRDEVLLKPGKLTDSEFEEIKTHTTRGAEVLDAVLSAAGEPVDYLEQGRKIALYHHERWDGKGYPARLKGKEIPIEARITSILDVFDALTHARCYKPAMTVEEACKIIREGRGTMFDPGITDVFFEMVDQIAEIMV